MMSRDNFDLEATLLEPFPRMMGGRKFLRVRGFRTDTKAYEAALLIKKNGGLSRVVKYTSYGSRSFRLYANANGKPGVKKVIEQIAHMGKKWSDW